MLAHNIPIKNIENQKLSNGELIDEWDKAFQNLSDKNTIFVGYNNQNYDNLLLQNSLFINLKFPYITSKQQFDLLPAVRACSVFAPNALKYELNAKGNCNVSWRRNKPVFSITNKTNLGIKHSFYCSYLKKL